jgi:hypothetical protein
MNTTIVVKKEVTTLINILTVEPEDRSRLVELLRDSTEKAVSNLDGWISTSFIAGKDQRSSTRSGATWRRWKRCKPIPR